MSFSVRFAVILLILVPQAAVTRAQVASNASRTPARIALNVVVTPKSGDPIANLQPSDFTILDNGAPRTLASFKAVSASQAPVEVILVVDAVNVDFNNVAYEREEIDKFLRANSGRLARPTALAIFTDNGIQMQEHFSTDGNQLSASLDQADIGLREIRRSAGFWGADDRLDLSINALEALITHEAPRPGRKIVLWISSGWPYLSGPRVVTDAKTQQQIFSQIIAFSNQLREANITVYSIDPLNASEGLGYEFYYQEFLKGIAKPQQTDVGDLALQVLAIQSGGLALSASNDIAGHLEHCIANIAPYYELTFTPPDADHPNEYHRIEIKVDKPGLTAHTRTGYYNQP